MFFMFEAESKVDLESGAVQDASMCLILDSLSDIDFLAIDLSIKSRELTDTVCSCFFFSIDLLDEQFPQTRSTSEMGSSETSSAKKTINS